MLKLMKRQSLKLGAAFTIGMLANADVAMAAEKNNFNSIAENVINSISSLPALLSGLSYLAGTLLGALGVLKIKDHVENPSQTPLKEGAIRLVAGGGLFALPIIFEAMQTTVMQDSATAPGVQGLQSVDFDAGIDGGD